MLDALKERLEALKTLPERAAPAAALAIAKKLQGDVKRSRAGARKRRKVERARRKMVGDKRRVSMGRAGSGIPILAVGTGDAITVTASNQVQYIAREKDEPAAWLELVGDAVRKTAGGR